ncbi:hypothetical protein NDU88_006636 [Pleurodeles waltl]|uniref:Uncharacterized protein n=1 Tax=Pleurodeles waltl TaxID=8319 RepID=A0AAV7WYT4_PLEWA|nr:hypothetical protein NDU88_006636 [Pleurodeles waltl]
MKRQTPDRGTTGRCWSGLNQRASVVENWPGRPDRRCAAAARPHRSDHSAGVQGRGRELVRGGSRLARSARSWHSRCRYATSCCVSSSFLLPEHRICKGS